MTLRELKNGFINDLERHYSEKEAERLFFIFLEQLGNITRIDYISDSGKPIDTAIGGQLDKVKARLQNGEPYQHILGKVEFAGLELKVSGAALIPRPETEELAFLIHQRLKDQPPHTVLDIGTGTGCLALAMARFFPGATVTGVDVSEVALALARDNGRINNLNVNFQHLNVLEWPDILKQGWDLIVSNPPYIAWTELDSIESVVKDYEPHNALFVDDNDPLIFYRVIAEKGQEFMKQGGKVFVEINERFGREVLDLFESKFEESELIKDLSGKDRFVFGEKA